ncbi:MULTISPECIES: phage major capsid protein [Streptomyces]|uniref:Phage major capsid protein n=3 Tax=Streptomyces rimosus TaxID=1927 RepID=L8F1U5_STRR1|nr:MULTISPECIES: phage major capsid protein [Streptomyces]KOG70516.1 phage head [Kitasatospora aureofaciens]MYT47292.1 phage major capsid protein [Streptomyces sp. SID5471]KEF04625.1 phage head [Streptomyces rimosus]KOT31344.1 phage head [Streptomyces sp. NRRL WC-3701]KOT32203.1 phage head [Streptomyces rimosus subsp. rimosus]
MPTATIEDLTGQMKHALTEARAIAKKAEDEDRDFTPEEAGQLREHMAKATEAKAAIEKAKGNDELRKTLADLGDDIALNAKTDDDGRRRTASGFDLPDRRKSIGQQFTDSPEYKALLAQAPSGQFGQKQRVQSGMAGFKSLVTGASDTSAGAWVTNDQIGLQVGLDAFQRPLRLRDVVTSGTTTSDTVEYVRVTSVTNAAAPVAEATTSAAPTAPGGAGALVNATGGGYKPESALAAAKVTAPVKTIAHWIPVTKRALSDAAQIRTLIDAFLRYGLEEELEDQMIQGDNTGENFEGLGNISGVQAQAWDTNALVTLRKAKTKVRTIGRSVANAYLLNPQDVETIDLLTDNENRYYFGGPSGTGSAQPLWNLPVIETEAVPAGTGYVGDFRKAILWDREQATIQMTDSHLDFFVRNLVAILAEMRAAFGVVQPNAFVEIDLTP